MWVILVEILCWDEGDNDNLCPPPFQNTPNVPSILDCGYLNLRELRWKGMELLEVDFN